MILHNSTILPPQRPKEKFRYTKVLFEKVVILEKRGSKRDAIQYIVLRSLILIVLALGSFSGQLQFFCFLKHLPTVLFSDGVFEEKKIVEARTAVE